MIASLTGELFEVQDDRAYLKAGPIVYELLIPAADVPLLQAAVGEETTFHTLFYIEGDASSGNLEPRLIGFLRREDKKFFEKFTTVKGIGPKKALKALVLPVGEIARAIEEKDTHLLVELPQIGKRMAELIVAELSGKLEEFALPSDAAIAAGRTGIPGRRSPSEEDAIATLVALGERRLDAEHLLDRTKQSNAALKTTDALVREMLRMRTVRAG
jgi:holliday junction DNA helicase RuvA